jgi:predicted extracellular nuclease
LTEFNRQRAKIIAALKALNADVVGLIEMENDGDGDLSAIADLVRGLNEATAEACTPTQQMQTMEVPEQMP